MSFLENITLPQDLKKLPVEVLPSVCKELRDFIIDHVSRHGGHFSASLGTVEMTVALHYVFDTPHDLIVWDVGHQAYGHKILTGRKDRFSTNRQYGGICGFPLREESAYDTFGVGHSSTSISAALGMNIASDYLGKKRKCIAVIGDGAMTAGLAFEAMNHPAVSGTDLLVILNDNNMSIDPNVGGLNKYLTSMTVSPTYNKFRDQVWDMLGKIPKVPNQARDFASRMEASVKGAMLVGSNLFESLGMRYLGMTDGHDVLTLIQLFRDIKKLESKGPQLLHLKTIKGKGFEQAEKNQTFWHAPGVFDKKTGNILASKSSAKKIPAKYQDIFGQAVIQLAKKNKKIMAITPAMPTGSSLKWMISEMPDRAFDVDICEQHAVTLSAGMATQGLRVFCTIYSSFMQKGYDQLIHDVAIQNLPVIFCIDRAGLVGEDGPTHHGVYDMAYMRCIPNMIVSAPMNENEMRDLMFTAQLTKITQPFSIRYPRGKGVLEKVKNTFAEIPIGIGRQIIKGKHIAVLTIGHIGNVAQQAIEELSSAGINPSLYDMRFVKPIDAGLIKKVVRKYQHIICIEDGCLQGGFGTAVLEVMHNINTSKALPAVTRIGVPDSVIPHGSVDELHKLCEMDLESIKKLIKKIGSVLALNSSITLLMFHESLYAKKPIGSIEVICGSMFSGKTEELMRRLRRVEYANQSLQIFKPAIDNRYAKYHIVSHDQRKFNAVMIKDSSEIAEVLKASKVNIDVVAIDEAQFFDENLVNMGVQLANAGYRIIVAGLDMDYLGKPFGVMPHFLAVADYVTKLHAICVHCGGIAQFTYRKTTEKQQTLVGTAKEYEPRCRACYQKR